MYNFYNFNLIIKINCDINCKHNMLGEAANESISNDVLTKIVDIIIKKWCFNECFINYN